jgi:hypothetical protein
MEMSGELHAPAALSPVKEPSAWAPEAVWTLLSCLRLTTACLGRHLATFYPMFVGPALPVSPCNGPVSYASLSFLRSWTQRRRVVLALEAVKLSRSF